MRFVLYSDEVTDAWKKNGDIPNCMKNKLCNLLTKQHKFQHYEKKKKHPASGANLQKFFQGEAHINSKWALIDDDGDDDEDEDIQWGGLFDTKLIVRLWNDSPTHSWKWPVLCKCRWSFYQRLSLPSVVIVMTAANQSTGADGYVDCLWVCYSDDGSESKHWCWWLRWLFVNFSYRGLWEWTWPPKYSKSSFVCRITVFSHGRGKNLVSYIWHS